MVFIMDRELNSTMSINMSEAGYGSISPGVRSLALDPTKKNLLLGTFGSEIYELAIEVESQLVNPSSPFMHGHYAPCKKVSLIP